MTVKDRLRDRIPWFLGRSPATRTRALIKALGDPIQEAKTAKELAQSIFGIRRPLRLWRDQNKPKEAAIWVDVALPNIKRVELYQDRERILDSGRLPQGTDEFKKRINITFPDTIPTSKFLLRVKDYDSGVYMKGIPENDGLVGNAYDRDLLLDLKGRLLGCPRYALTKPDYRHLDRAYPPFHDQRTEPDYYYEKRLDQFLRYLDEHGVIFASIFRLLGVEPTISGFWRQLCEMNRSRQSEKYMKTKNWNPSVFFVTIDIDSLPMNIRWDSDEFEQVIDSMSASKKFYFQAAIGEAFEDGLTISESWDSLLSPATDDTSFSDAIEGDSGGFLDDGIAVYEILAGEGSGEVPDGLVCDDEIDMSGEGTISEFLNVVDEVSGDPGGELCDGLVFDDLVETVLSAESEDSFGFSDELVPEEISGAYEETLSISESVEATATGEPSDDFTVSDSVESETAGAYEETVRIGDSATAESSGAIRTYDTDTEFSQLTRSNVQIVGSGTSAYITIPSPTTSNTGAKRPTSASNIDYSSCRYIGYWYNRSNALGACDGTGAVADTPAQTCYTDILRLSGFSFGVPSNATIRGIEAAISRRQSGTVNRVDQLIRINVGGINSNNKADTSTYWPQSYSTKTYGGSSDLWGLSNVTPSNINTLYLDISAKNNYPSADATFYVDCAWVKVYYAVPTSGSASYTLTGSNVGVGNNLGQVVVNATVPSGCTLSFTAKKNGSTVKTANITGGTTISLTDVTVSSSSDQFKFIFSFQSSDTATPQIDKIQHNISISRTF